MLTAITHISTLNPQRIMKRLSKHWTHKFAVKLEETSSFIPLSIGECYLHCQEEQLEVKVTAVAENLARIQEVVADHLIRMAKPEEISINWQTQGRLLLVSTGIGEPDNLTLRAQKAIQQADLIVGMQGQRERVAHLIEGKQVLDAGHGLFTELARRSSDIGAVETHEEQIQKELRAAWAAGKTIVVLEMGDPCLFGPQEGYLHAFADLNPEVIPGISSFNAANALLARPLLNSGKQKIQLSGLQALEEANKDNLPDTWVLFCMGLEMPSVLKQLEKLYSPSTKIALVLEAGFNQQRIIEANLAELPQRLENEEIPWAVLIYVGV